jgi:hypothetical protein
MGSKKLTLVSRPMARAEGLLIEPVGDETVVYDLQSKEAHCLKSLAAVVFAHADGHNTTADIAELASYRLGSPVTESQVGEVIDQLEQRALLDVPLAIRDGLSRRQAVKRIAGVAGAAAATPLIASIIAPAAASASSLVPIGGCCGNSATSNCTGLNNTCQPAAGTQDGHCCQNVSSKDCNQCKCVGDKNACGTAFCSGPAAGCSPVPGQTGTPCGSNTNGKCCYPTPEGSCCNVIIANGGGVINC